MVIASRDFLVTQPNPDAWADIAPTIEVLDRDRVARLIEAPDPTEKDLDVALALMDLVRDDLLASGTGEVALLSDEDMRVATRALHRVTTRSGHEFQLPFRDHASWKAWWLRNGAYSSYQARRDLLSGLFDQPYAGLMAAQDRALDSTLIEAVSPRERLGWVELDTEIGELRRHFRTATTPQDYRAIGNDCVHITEALSRKVYDHEAHTPEGEEEPAVSQTKKRLDRYVAVRLPGPENAELRRFGRASIELAQAVKHSGSPTRTEAGILADAVIALANMLRRLDEEPPNNAQEVTFTQGS